MESLTACRDKAQKLIELLDTLETPCAECAHQAARTSTDAAALVMQMIEACPAGVPTIRELARITATSPTKLQQDFRQAFGCTIHHCKQQRRMALAALLLEHSDKTVSQIAREVGLNKAGHFSAIFKRYHGISPTDYRSATRGMAD